MRPPPPLDPSRAAGGPPVDLSIVAPAYDEEGNLEPLYEEVRAALDGALRWELVLVDDGSRDGTAGVIEELCARDPRVVGVFLGENCGQTAATASGLAVARAPLVATVDADLQNDPRDLPRMVEALGGADAICGVRVRRRDGLLRRASSRAANAVRNRVVGEAFRDTGCALKVFRAHALEALPLFDGMHRFLPTLLRIHGFRVEEVEVAHRPRTRGRSKYGVLNRVFRTGRDLLAVRWMRARAVRLPAVRVERSAATRDA